MAIKGAIKVNGIPESACFTNFRELLQSLGQYLTVEIPDQNFSNVIISVSQPGAADTNKLWVQLGSSGTFLALKMYDPNTSVWVAIYPVPGQIFWLTGSSATPPPGFKFLELADGYLTNPDYTDLLAASALPTGAPPYTYYPAIFIGF